MEDVIQIVGMFTAALYGSSIAARAANNNPVSSFHFVLFAAAVTAVVYPYLLG